MKARAYEVLLAAVEMYSAVGDRFRVSELGKRAGYCDASGPIHYFGDKHNIMRHVVQYAVAQPEHPLHRRVILRATLDPSLSELVPDDVYKLVLARTILAIAS